MEYRVHFESSAAVGIEVVIEATDENEANMLAQDMYDKGELKLDVLVDELIKPHPLSTKAYAKHSGLPVAYATIELDEAGFEIVDSFEPLTIVPSPKAPIIVLDEVDPVTLDEAKDRIAEPEVRKHDDGMVKAPFTAEQVAALNHWQQQKLTHPFTCPGNKPGCQSHRELIATSEGWVCACGEYKQDWAHDFMVEPAPPYLGVVPYSQLDGDLRAAKDRIAELEGQLARLEKERPHWAQGYTSDSVAAQVTTTALNALWELLGVANQTEAVAKLKQLVDYAKPAGVPKGKTPETDALVKQLSEAHHGETVHERASRVEAPLVDLCRKLERERDEARWKREHTEQWYAERLEPIKDVAKRVGAWDEVAAIIANGSGTRQLPDGTFHYEPPTYAQQLNMALHRAEAAEKKLAEAERKREGGDDTRS